MIIREDPHWGLIVVTDEPAPAQWTWMEDRVLEQALANIPNGVPNRWEMIALYLPGKTANDVAMRYHDLVRDVGSIDAGQVKHTSYAGDSVVCSQEGGNSSWDLAVIKHDSGRDSSANQNLFEATEEPERKKGTPWTVEEHKLFLKGLQLYGKGDWKNIARNVVLTRTPTQVASHAQKFFLRQASAGKKERKRASINDINTVEFDWLPVPPPVYQKDSTQPHSANYQPPDQQIPMLMSQPQPRFIPNQGDPLGYQTYDSGLVPVMQFDDQKSFIQPHAANQPHDQQLPMLMNQPQPLKFIPNQGDPLGFRPYDSDPVSALLSDDQKNIQPPSANPAASSADVNIVDVTQPVSLVPKEGGLLKYHSYDFHPVPTPPFDGQTNFIQPPDDNPAATATDANIVDEPQPLGFIPNEGGPLGYQTYGHLIKDRRTL